MAAPLTWEELKTFEADIPEDLANDMIKGVWARAVKVAPCLKTMEWSEDEDADEYDDTQLVKSVIRGACLRWYDSGSGAAIQRAAGEYSETLTGYSGGLLRPDEVRDLQKLCSDLSTGGRATTIPTGLYSTPVVVVHADWCSIRFGATYCDCGAELTADGMPLWVH